MAATPLPLERRIKGLVYLLLIFGQVILFSATGVMGAEDKGSEFFYLSRQFLGSLIGLSMMFLLSRVKYQVIGKIAPILLSGQVLLTLLCFLPPFSHQAQGVNRWIALGPITFQPSELAKITLIAYIAQILALRDSMLLTYTKKIKLCLPVILLLALIFKQPDLGSTILLTVTIIALLFIAGARLTYVMGFMGLGSMLFALSFVNSGYRKRRLLAFLNPWADPQGDGFQSIQSYLSFYSGKLFGTGIGNGNSKLFYLPEVHTDFIFALVGEELGFVGAMGLVIIFAYLGYLLFKLARFAPDPFGRYLAFGLSFILMLQIIVNLGGVTGIIPVKGLPLPFISWGRSALVVNLAMMGILLNIAYQSSPSSSVTTNQKGSSPRKGENSIKKNDRNSYA